MLPYWVGLRRCAISEYIVCETQITNANALKEALTESGYVFEEHKTAQTLYGYLGDKRTQKAHVIVRREHVGSAANDVGFLRHSNGTYEMIISEYDRNLRLKQGQNFMKKLKQIYGKHHVLVNARRMGLHMRAPKIKKKGNKIEIECTYMGP